MGMYYRAFVQLVVCGLQIGPIILLTFLNNNDYSLSNNVIPSVITRITGGITRNK